MLGWLGLVRSAMISAVLVAIGAVLIIEFGPNNSIGFMHLKVINNTERALKIQPCWDIGCLNRVGLAATVIPPHRTPILPKQWENTYWQTISVVVLKPSESTEPPFEACVVTDIPPKRKVGVIRVTDRNIGPCPDGGGGGSVG